MSDIPIDVVTPEELAEWYRTKEELGKLKSKEALLRSRIFKFYFPDPAEGTNSRELGDGTGAVVKGTYVINRSVDQGALDALREAQKVADSNAYAINLDVLVVWKPELKISEYRTLTDEERNWFDQALVIKPGSPQVEVVIPKRPKAGG